MTDQRRQFTVEADPVLIDVLDVTIGVGFFYQDEDPSIALIFTLLRDPDDPASATEYKFGLTLNQADVMAAKVQGAVMAAVDVIAIQKGWEAITLAKHKREVERQRARAATVMRQSARAHLADPREQCAWEGCHRVAVFGEGGKRYCKRHAEQAGIRPHGKII